MTTAGLMQIAIYCAVLLATVKPLGSYMARVYEGEAKLAQRILGAAERLVYRLLRIEPHQEMTWKTYAVFAKAYAIVTGIPLTVAE